LRGSTEPDGRIAKTAAFGRHPKDTQQFNFLVHESVSPSQFYCVFIIPDIGINKSKQFYIQEVFGIPYFGSIATPQEPRMNTSA
jgi:hypothetical protein